jgi:hypothetical protein
MYGLHASHLIERAWYSYHHCLMTKSLARSISVCLHPSSHLASNINKKDQAGRVLQQQQQLFHYNDNEQPL